MAIFSDILYGQINLPDWLSPFVKAPEFLRLRGVRLSNVDSVFFKDFNGPTRWEHSLAVASLAFRCAELRNLSPVETIELTIAALFHDVATPPFAHTLESVVPGFSHEEEAQRLLLNRTHGNESTIPVFASQLPQFERLCDNLSRQLRLPVNHESIAELIIGRGPLGFLLNGSIDLDNIDNVIRANMYMGFEVDKSIPGLLVEWLAAQQSTPLNTTTNPLPFVREWHKYKNRMYRAFYEANDEELGREAFLRYLFKFAIDLDIPRQSLFWSTDADVLSLLEKFGASNSPLLVDLVQRYKLLESPQKLCEFIVRDESTARRLQSREAINYLEETWSFEGFAPFVFMTSKRFKTDQHADLFEEEFGKVALFKLGSFPKSLQLPDWIQNKFSLAGIKQPTRKDLSEVLQKQIVTMCREAPWITNTSTRRRKVQAALDAFGDWGFRLSKNESFHPYPSTFVHAIPSSLINALGLQTSKVLDPFGGTGQTVTEAVRSGAFGISSDINALATLTTKARTTFLGDSLRNRIRQVNKSTLQGVSPDCEVDFPLKEKWHHPNTFYELSQILTFIHGESNSAVKRLMKVAFSAILPSSTARKGKEHGFFADNTPLPAGVKTPEYIDAFSLFLNKLKRNVDLLECFYASIERQGRDPASELKRSKVVQMDSRTLSLSALNQDEPLDAIITSPPYLCMTDYTLGQRLSYHWLFPGKMQLDYQREIGARRQRFSPHTALSNYLKDIEQFANQMSTLIRPGGYLCTVLGAPVAKAFAEANLIAETDLLFSKAGFQLIWERDRNIQWHRNHGYQRLVSERIAVYTVGS